MSRSRTSIVLAAAFALASMPALRADVRSDQKTKFQLAGALGRVVNIFGGKAAREGVTTTIALKGNRMLTTSGDSSGQIVDLAEEKIYDLDLKKKSYKVTTFADIRRQMEEARARAKEEASKEAAAAPAAKEEPAKPDPDAKQVDVDFEVKNTGEKKDINGFSTSRSIMTITVREKGKTLQQSGGLVLNTDIWLTPSIPAMKELSDFNLKYAQKLYGPVIEGASPQEMASALAMYPMMKPAFEKMATEAQKLQGTAILTTTTVDAVKSAEQVAAEKESASDSRSSSSAPPASVGGLLGGFGRRMAQRKSGNDEAAAAGPKDRATVVTTTSEVLKVATAVSAEEVAIPAGFKESK
ncbi:MAG TPA: hypothetical protein VM032_04170 [Vicinamibacterales bacterium]|nr:hypothetical protein [Vicinamibacterales bacterium]